MKKMSCGSLKNIIYKMCLDLIYMYQKELELNNLQ